MVDLLRSYRRWLVRRLALLVPAFVLALGANLWIAMGPQIDRWLKVLSLVLSGGTLATLGYLLSETLACAAAQRRGSRETARALRGQLSLSGRVAGVCLLVLAVLVGAPALVRSPAPRDPLPPHARRPRAEPSPPPPVEAPVEFTQVVALAADDPAPPPRAQIVPEIADVPRRLAFEEKEIDVPLALAPFLQDPEPKREDVEEESGAEALRFRPEPPPAAPLVVGVDRLGLPGEEDVDAAPPPSLRIEVLFLRSEDVPRGAGLNAEFDQVVSRDGSLRVGFMALAFGEGDDLDEYGVVWSWQRVTLGYQQRLLGYTRRAAFDLAISAGLAVDRFAADHGALDTSARISPYVALDAGLWQQGAWGFTLRLGHSLRTNLTGASASVSEVALAVRVDLTERLSLYAGHRTLFVDLRTYPGGGGLQDSREERDETLSGPLIGLEYRF